MRVTCSGNLVGVAPASAIFMAVYEPSKSWIYERHGQQAASLGAGALAGLAASLVRVPTEVCLPPAARCSTEHLTTAAKYLLQVLLKFLLHRMP